MARHKDENWDCGGHPPGYPGAQLAVMMDLRDELKKLNGLLHCSNFVAIPTILRAIKRGKCHRRHVAK